MAASQALRQAREGRKGLSQCGLLGVGEGKVRFKILTSELCYAAFHYMPQKHSG